MFWEELFIDKNLIADSSNPEHYVLKIYQPEFKKLIFKPKDQWDKHNFTTYFNMAEFNGKVMIFYRGNLSTGNTNYHCENTCILVSTDGGLTFKKPNVNIFNDKDVGKSRPKSKKPKVKSNSKSSDKSIDKSDDKLDNEPNQSKNNVVWRMDGITHNFFVIQNRQDPKILNAIGGVVAGSCNCCGNGVYLMQSTDGFNWTKGKQIFHQKHSQKQGYGTLYDSMNVIAWDNYRQEYRSFMRYNYKRAVRCIQSLTTKDLSNWEFKTNKLLKYRGRDKRLYYIPSIASHPNNGCFIGFPSGQSADQRNSQKLDLIASRDGIHYDVLSTTWMNGLVSQPERMIPYILRSPDRQKCLLYFNDAKTTKLDLYTIRWNGFASISNQDSNQSWFITKPFYLTKNDLSINYRINSESGLLEMQVYLLEEEGIEKLIISNKWLTSSKTPAIFNTKISGLKDSVEQRFKLPAKIENNYVCIKFITKDVDLFSYNYHTLRDKVLPNVIQDKSDYIDIRTSKDDISKKTIKELVQIKNKEIKKENKEIKKENKEIIKENKEIKKESVIDYSHLKNINGKLSKKPSNKINYIYYDLLKMGDEGSKRIKELDCVIKEIININYLDFHSAGGGSNKNYGRKFQFTAIDINNNKVVVKLINNSRSNCKVEFY
tara:strand:+ start:4766 stop:6733 length:1968 start_codon:yes stop_codon:yes gene_type:complete